MDKKFYHQCLGEQLHRIRIERRIRQADLADITNLARLTVRGIERGKGNLSSFHTLADALGLGVAFPRCPEGTTIGQVVARIRRRKKISQRTLATAVGVSHPTVIKLEKTDQGRLSTLNDISSFLQVRPKLLERNRKKHFREVSKSRNTDEWYSPPDLLTQIKDASGAKFDLDPCSPTTIFEQAPVKASRYYTVCQDGLAMKWNGRVYMNPPYSQIGHWVRKARSSVEQSDAETVFGLVPARTDTRWWNENVAGFADVFFLRGRITFSGHPNAAPFPSAVVVWGGDTDVVGRLKMSLNAFHMPSSTSA